MYMFAPRKPLAEKLGSTRTRPRSTSLVRARVKAPGDNPESALRSAAET